MRDIGRKIQRYRLSRYGGSSRAFPLRWLWVALGAWLLWAGVVSDHSFYQLWKLQREKDRRQKALAVTREELQDLERRTTDPTLQREEAERLLRELNGMAKPGEIIYRIDDGRAYHPAAPDSNR